MYFFKEKGTKCLDMKGNLVLSHNTQVFKTRHTGDAPRSVKNQQYIKDITRLSFRWKVYASLQALKFIWGPSQELTTDECLPEQPVTHVDRSEK